MKVVERIEGCYETREVPFGRVYVWRPGRVVVECNCGERQAATGPAATCGCGERLAATLREMPPAGRPGDEALHPWRYAGDHEEASYLARRVS